MYFTRNIYQFKIAKLNNKYYVKKKKKTVKITLVVSK